jgi:hypothetical protein
MKRTGVLGKVEMELDCREVSGAKGRAICAALRVRPVFFVRFLFWRWGFAHKKKVATEIETKELRAIPR